MLLAVAGCGGGERESAPRLPAPLAQELALRSDAVADRLDAGDPCAARAEADALHADAIAAVNARRVPPALQEHLLGSVSALRDAIACAPPAEPGGEPEDDDEDDEDDDEDDGEGKRKGEGKQKGKRK